MQVTQHMGCPCSMQVTQHMGCPCSMQVTQHMGCPCSMQVNYNLNMRFHIRSAFYWEVALIRMLHKVGSNEVCLVCMEFDGCNST